MPKSFATAKGQGMNGPSDYAKFIDKLPDYVPFKDRTAKERARILLAIRDNTETEQERALCFKILDIELPVTVLQGLAAMHG